MSKFGSVNSSTRAREQDSITYQHFFYLHSALIFPASRSHRRHFPSHWLASPAFGLRCSVQTTTQAVPATPPCQLLLEAHDTCSLSLLSRPRRSCQTAYFPRMRAQRIRRFDRAIKKALGLWFPIEPMLSGVMRQEFSAAAGCFLALRNHLPLALSPSLSLARRISLPDEPLSVSLPLRDPHNSFPSS